MTPSNRIVQGLWIGPSLSIMEQLSIRSFLANGHEYHLYVYDTPTDVPAGTVLKDANEILDRSRIWRYKDGFGKGSVAGFADFFRYVLLYKRGGWWVDTDVVCLRPFDHQSDIVICTSDESEYGHLACTFVLKFPAGNEYAKYLVNVADRPNVDEIKFGDIGPFLVQRMVKELDLNRYLAPPNDFAPIGWRGLSRIVREPTPLNLRSAYRFLYWQWRWLSRPQTYPGRVRSSSYGLHLWNEYWRNNGFDKNRIYSPSCLYEQLKHRYLSDTTITSLQPNLQ